MTPVIVFAKAPRPGEVKTRLIPALGAPGAAKLHERLATRAIVTAVAAALGPVELCCAPGAAHPFFAWCAAAHDVVLTQQGDGDLGERMLRAADRVLRTASRAILIGCDCPALSPAYLRAAAAALDGGFDAVVGPAEDGGYVLLGLTRSNRALFDGLQWGGPDVMLETTARLDALGWRWRTLDTLWDVDRPDDLDRLRREISDGERLLRDIGQ
jgi:rSAM/selenodomain-associated transferase 1